MLSKEKIKIGKILKEVVAMLNAVHALV